MKAISFFIILSLLLSVPCYAEQEQTVTVAGRVVDYKARPVEKASVACYNFYFKPNVGRNAFELLGLAETKSDGRFSLEIKKIYHMPLFVARKQGLSLGWKKAIVPKTTIILGRPNRLEGTIVDVAGNPVSDASVQIFLHHRVFAFWPGDFSLPSSFRVEEISPVSPVEWFITKTDKEGRFAFDHIPDEATADFQAEASGYAPAYTFREGIDRGRQFAAGRTDIRIVLEPEATITGRIIDEDTGQTISGIPLLIKPKDGPSVYEEPIVSDSEGRFLIKGLPAVDYSLQLQYSDDALPVWVGRNVEVSMQASQSVNDVEIPVGKGATIEVLVVDSEKIYPIEDVEVQIEHESEDCSSCQYSRKTDVNGVTRFRLPPGQCRVLAHKSGLGHTGISEIVSVEKGQHIQHTINDFAYRPLNIAGRVLNIEGQEVTGARVMWHGVIADTDEKGQFEYEIYQSRFSASAPLLIRDESGGLAVRTILRDPTRSGLIQGDVTLKPGATLTGRVTDQNNKGIPAAYVRLLKQYDRRFITEVTTDTRGFYSIPALPDFDDKSLTLVVRVTGFGPVEFPCPSFQAGQVIQVDPIKLSPTDQFVSGVVLDVNDQPIPHTALYLSGPDDKAAGQPSRVVSTDNNGQFRIDGVCKGPLRIRVENGFIDAYGGAEDIKVVLGKQLVHTRHESLAGKSLPDTTELGLNLSSVETNNKMIIVCFFDMNQRPSRNCLLQLSKRAEELMAKDVVVVAVQVSKVDDSVLNEWVEKNNISFPVGTITADVEKTRFTWGVRSLPWLILTDKEHIVTAEGFSVAELDKKLKGNSN